MEQRMPLTVCLLCRPSLEDYTLIESEFLSVTWLNGLKNTPVGSIILEQDIDPPMDIRIQQEFLLMQARGEKNCSQEAIHIPN